MKPIRLLALLLFPLFSLGQSKFLERLTFEENLGLGFATQNNDVTGTPAYLAGSISLIMRGRWLIGVGASYLAFRDAFYLDKTGLFTQGYIRNRYTMYGLKFGKVLLDDSLGFHLVVTAGIDQLQVDKPYKSGSGYFGPKYDYIRSNHLNVPIQLAFRIPVLPRWIRRVTLDVLVISRWNINAHHAFPTLSVGPSVGLYTSRRSRY